MDEVKIEDRYYNPAELNNLTQKVKRGELSSEQKRKLGRMVLEQHADRRGGRYGRGGSTAVNAITRADQGRR